MSNIQGRCPNCYSPNLSYEYNAYVSETSKYHKVECMDCNQLFLEWYKIVFKSVEKIKSEKGYNFAHPKRNRERTREFHRLRVKQHSRTRTEDEITQRENGTPEKSKTD